MKKVYFNIDPMIPSILLYFLLVLLMVGYLLIVPYYSNKHMNVIFWSISILLTFTFIWQTINIKSKNILLLELIIMIFLFHLIFILPVPYGLFGRDVHYEISATNIIAEKGWPVSNISDSIEIISKWPLIHFYGIIFSKITKMELFNIEYRFTVTRIIPSLVNSLIIPIFFKLAQIISKDIHVSLISTISAFSLYYNLMFHSLYVRETFAYVFYIMIVYIICKRIIYENERTIKNSFLIFILFIGLAFSHHLTFLLIIYFILLISVSMIISKMLNFKTVYDYHMNNNILAFASILFFIYLIYIGKPIFDTLIISTKTLFTSTILPFAYTPQERLLKDEIILILRIVFTALFALFILYNLKINYYKKNDLIFWNISFLLTTLSFFIIIFIFNSMKFSFNIGYYRIESFVWPFFIIIACCSLSKITKNNKFYYIFGFFILFNLFQIPTYIYDPILGTSGNDESMIYNISEYKAVNWINSKTIGDGRIIGDVVVDELLGSKPIIKYVVTEIPFYDGNFNNLRYYDWIYIRKNNFNRIIGRDIDYETNLDASVFYKVENNNNLYRVYDNGNTYLFKINMG